MKNWLLSTLLVSVGLVAGFTHIVPGVSAASYVVSNLNDSGPGSLREAISFANANLGPDTITFDAGLLGGTIQLTSTLRIQSPGITIDGGVNRITLDGALIPSTQSTAPVLIIDHDTLTSPISATVKNLTIRNPNGNGIFVGNNASGIPSRTVGSLELEGIQVTALRNGLFIFSPNVSNVSIRNSTVIASTGGYTASAIGICKNVNMGPCDTPIAVSNLKVLSSTLSGNPGIGVFAGGGGPSTITGVEIMTSTITAQSLVGVRLGEENSFTSGPLTVQGVTLTNNTIQGSIGVYIGGISNASAIVQTLSVKDNTITGTSGNGILIRGKTLGDVSINQNKSLQGQGTSISAAVSVQGGTNDLITIGSNTVVRGLAQSSGVIVSGTVNSRLAINSNTITASGADGVRIFESSSGSGNSILSNTISQSPNGISLVNASNWSIRNNTLTSNTSAGVRILSGSGNRIGQNSINSTTGLGIDLGGDGATPNDQFDLDAGPNNLQNYPVLTSIVRSAENTTVQGTLNSTRNTPFTLEFFASPTSSASQGKDYLGATTVTTGDDGNASFTVMLGATNASDVVSATATDPGNNTSEFTPPNTPTGSNVSVELGTSGTVTYGSVSAAGTTLVSVSNTGSSLPTGFAIGDSPTYYDISTTAAYSTQINVCLKYDPANYSAQYPPRLLHYENGLWVDVTTSVDAVNVLVCGKVNSLSPFVVAKKDTTLPSINIASPISASYFLGQLVPATYSCADQGSGVASCVGTVANGANFNTASVGAKTFTVNAMDKAGNANTASVSYNVIYNFTGFFQPVDNLPTLNQAKSGSAIPVKFGLAGNQGLAIFAAGYPASQPIACDGSTLVADIEQIVTAGNSSLAYEPGNQQYNYVWKTDSAWAGTCRALIVKLIDGTEHKANFKFK